MKVINDLLNYNSIKIVQDTEMFSFSLDSVLLPNFVTITSKTGNILDIGTGNAPIPLILSTKTDTLITAVEVQKSVYDMAVESILINKKEDQISIINMDINNYAKEIESDQYDTIICNPPFFKYDSNSNINKSEYKTIARHELLLNLSQLFNIAKKLLKNGGNVAIVHRASRLIDIIEEMRKNNIEPKKLQFVYSKKGQVATTILIEGIKNGNSGIKVLEPLYTHNDDGSYSQAVKQMFE